MLDFLENAPYTYLNSFKDLIRERGLDPEMLTPKDLMGDTKGGLQSRFDDCQFIIVRKPLAVLLNKSIRDAVTKAVQEDGKNLLVMYSFVEDDAHGAMNSTLEPFNIQSTSIKVFDDVENEGSKRMVTFRDRNWCFVHEDLMKEVTQVTIPHPHHLEVQAPSKPVIVGNSTTIAMTEYDVLLDDPKGKTIVVAACYEEKGRLILTDSTIYLDSYISWNKKFISNILDWLQK